MPASNSATNTDLNTSSGPLSSDEIDRFNRDGFLVKDFGFSDALIDGVVNDVYPHYGEAFRANPTFPERLHNGWTRIDSVKKLAIYPAVLDALEQLWGRKALAFQTLNFPIGTSQKIHSDTIHFNTEPSGFMAGVWVALEDIDISNGPLAYYPGSHKLPTLTMPDLNLQAGREHYAEYEDAIEKLIEEKNLVPELGLVRKGEAIIWHANLLHGGHPHEDPNRSRHSQVTHYFFENCRYYTPLFHDENHEKEFHNPEWINQESQPKGWLRRIRNRLLYR